MKRFHVLLLALVLLIFSFSPQSIFASSNAKTEITYNPDGSYVITTLNISYTAAYSTSKTASKTAVAYSPNGSKICTFTVTGTFEINSGSSVSCTSASYSKSIYDSTWNFISASTSRNNSSSSQASASAKGYFKNATGGSQTLTPTVYCDKNGNIS